MEPVCFNTGNLKAVPSKRMDGDASMEPVCFNTGNAEIVDRYAEICNASMEPVCFNTGNVLLQAVYKRDSPSFNGAGVFQHRKRERGK